VRSKPKDFAEQPPWSGNSRVTGGHACLGQRSGCVARNDRRLLRSSVVSRPGTRPGCSSQTRSSSRQTSECSSSASATPMQISPNSISWGKILCRWRKQRQARRLDSWLARASQSSSGELQGFASGIKRDYAAVKAALTLPWSQGQVEGQITRLKFLKRQMYGRAHFDLLRSRVLRRA